MTNEQSLKVDELDKNYQTMAETIKLDSKYESMEIFYKRLFVENFWRNARAVERKVSQRIYDEKPKQIIDVSKLSKDPMYYSRSKIYVEDIDKYNKQYYKEEIQKHLQYIIDEDKCNAEKPNCYFPNGRPERLNLDLINEMIEEYFDRFCELIKRYIIEYLRIWNYKVISFEQENKELGEAISKWAEEYNSKSEFERKADAIVNNIVNRETAPTLKEGYVVLFFCLAIEFIFNHFYSWWIITIIIFLCWRKKEIDKYHGRGNKKDLWKW